MWRSAMRDLLDTIARGDEYKVVERVGAARALLAGWSIERTP